MYFDKFLPYFFNIREERKQNYVLTKIPKSSLKIKELFDLIFSTYVQNMFRKEGGDFPRIIEIALFLFNFFTFILIKGKNSAK